jgi:hypothetical protein
VAFHFKHSVGYFIFKILSPCCFVVIDNKEPKMMVCRSPVPHFRTVASGIENVLDGFPFLSCVSIQWCFLELIYISYPSRFMHVYWRNNCRHTNDFRIFKYPVFFHSFISVHKVTDCSEFFILRYLTWQVLNSISFVDHNQINFLRYWKPLQRWCKIIKFYQYAVHKVHGRYINVQHLTPYLKPFNPL